MITALFADISGFTALADKLDAETVHEVIAPLITRLARCAERYGGTVAKFAGDALLVFFGAPVAFEDHAARALAVALDMHVECARALKDLPPIAAGLELHIGVNTGSVIAGRFGGEVTSDYSILGDAVNIAQRLESAAPRGETYVGAQTAVLAGNRFRLEALDRLTVKGKSDPLTAFRLIGHGEPAPPRASSVGLVGREREIARVAQARAAGRVVGIVGEAGAGKSALLWELGRRFANEGTTWLQARCESFGATVAYQPFAELLRRHFGLKDHEDDALALLERATGEAGIPEAVGVFAGLLGVAGHDQAPQDPRQYRRALHDAVTAWLQMQIAAGPVVLSVEDLHWADEASLVLLSDLMRIRGLSVLVTSRPDGRPAAERFAEPEDIVELGGLSREAIREIITRLLGGDPPLGLTEAVVERAQGNPLFVEEIVRSMRDAKMLFPSAGGGWTLAPGWDAAVVPATVEGVLGARIDALPAEAAKALSVASVIGRFVPAPLLCGVAGLADCSAAIENLVLTGFLDPIPGMPEETYLLHHGLVQEVAYARMIRGARRELHMRVAEAVEQIYGAADDSVELLARNYYLGGGGLRALDASMRAADRARRLNANESAITHLTHALEIASTDAAGRESDIALQLADLLELVGRYDDALVFYAQIRDATGEIAAWRGMASSLRKNGSYAEALELIADAINNGVGGSDGRAALLLERAWTQAVEGDFAGTIGSAVEGLALSPERNAITANLLVQMARASLALSRHEEAMRHAMRALEIFQELDDLRGQSTVLRMLGPVNLAAGDFDTAIAWLEQGLTIARKIGNVEEVGGCLVNLSHVAERRGDADESAAYARAAILEFERIGHAAGRAISHGNLATALVLLGRDSEAMDAVETALEIARTIGLTPIIADALETIARLHGRASAHREAAEAAEEAAALWHQVGEDQRAAEALRIAAVALRSAGDARADDLDARAADLVG